MDTCRFTLAVAAILITTSCKKEVHQMGQQNRDFNASRVMKLPSSAEELLLVENLAKITELMKELYKDQSNLKLVNAAIFAHAYTDESILLKDLIYPAQSRLYNNAEFQVFVTRWNLSLKHFSNKFWKEVQKTADSGLESFLMELGPAGSMYDRSNDRLGRAGTRRFIDDQQVSIYFPFSEVFAIKDTEGDYSPVATLAAATADTDAGWGSEPYYENGVLQYYTPVLVDDDYAYSHPTQIIGVNGVEPYTEPSTVPPRYLPPPGAVDLPDLTREVKQVYIGDVRIHNHQYDKLISFTGNGGGSEIRFTRADGYLKVADGQVQTADVYFAPAKEISRYNIKHSKWVDFSFEWDSDWELLNLQQNLAIYEDDNRNTSIFNGSLTTTLAAAIAPVSATIQRSLNFTINFKSDDELIRQTNLNRDVFFVLNSTNLEGEMRNGVPVRDRNASVSFTLRDRTFY